LALTIVMNITYAFIVNYFVEFVYHLTDLRYGITGYFWGPESSSKDFLKPVKEEFGVGHAA